MSAFIWYGSAAIAGILIAVDVRRDRARQRREDRDWAEIVRILEGP